MVHRPEQQEITVGPDAAGERLDRFMRRTWPIVSRAELVQRIAQGAVRVNGRSARKGQVLREGDRIATETFVQVPTPDATLALRVLYEDDWLVVVDKAAGVPSHPLRLGEQGTVASALLARYPEMAGVGHRPLEPGLLHRLDTDTSGLLIAVRDAQTFSKLRTLHARGAIDKRYLALCSGRIAPRVEHAYLAADRRRVRVSAEPVPGARRITSEILYGEPFGELSLTGVRVAFAARHQVRAHLAALGHPIAGDALYGGPALAGLDHHFLHASELRFEHPVTGRALQLTAALPDDLQQVLAGLA